MCMWNIINDIKIYNMNIYNRNAWSKNNEAYIYV